MTHESLVTLLLGKECALEFNIRAGRDGMKEMNLRQQFVGY